MQAVARAMDRMREMVQQSTSSSTELAAAAEQMSKLSRALLESMDRFAIDENKAEVRRPTRRKPALEPAQDEDGEYAEATRS